MLFDDDSLTIRYVVVDTGGILTRHEVLVSPFLVGELETGQISQHIRLKATKDQIEKSPPISTDAPVSRKAEEALAKHFGHPPYWTQGPSVVPATGETKIASDLAEARETHLRSAKEVTGYEVCSSEEAEPEPLGTISDIVFQTNNWTLRYFVVNTGSWFNRKPVIVSPRWTKTIHWSNHTVVLDQITKEHLKGAPLFDPHSGINRDYEGRLFDYYGKPVYWE